MEYQYFTDYFKLVESAVKEIPYDLVAAATDILARSRQLGQRVWIVGNGGSAATAMHFANDLQKMCGLDVIALPSNIPTILAYGNDDGWENMFSHALQSSFSVGDILVAISCSGTSKNVVNAAKAALKKDGKLISITGPKTPKNDLAAMRGVVISVDVLDIKAQEDIHMIICHSIAGAIAQ
jgi:D-sedoheptulose 7-phosphate isomerase